MVPYEGYLIEGLKVNILIGINILTPRGINIIALK